MKRFRFRLQSVLQVRDLAEKRAQEAFLVAQGKRLQCSAAVSAARASGEALYALSLESRRSRLQAVECVRQHDELERAQEQLVVAIDRERAALAEEESARKVWIDARRSLRTIERLRDKARAEHVLESLRIEQEMLDELAVLRAPRSHGTAT